MVDGMICLNESGNVIYINLCYQFLEHKREKHLSEDIGEMQELEGLILNGNRINGTLPIRLGELTKLRELNLSENELCGQLPESMSRLSALTDLNLGDNPDLRGDVHTQVMKYCPNLKHCLYDIYLWHHIQKDSLRKVLLAMGKGKRKKKKRDRIDSVMITNGGVNITLELSKEEISNDQGKSVDGENSANEENSISVSQSSSPETKIKNISIANLLSKSKKKKMHHHKEEEEEEEDDEAKAERERLEEEKRQEELLERKRLEMEAEKERLRMLDVTVDANMKTWLGKEIELIANKPEVKLASENDVDYNPTYEVIYDAEDKSYR